MNLLRFFVIVVLSELLFACGSTPATKFYVLDALSTPAITQSNTKKIAIGVGPLSIPALLKRKQIVTRDANHSIQFAEFQQWAEPLEENILAVLTKNLTAKQPNKMIRSYPWATYGDMDYRLIINISRFDSQAQTAVLDANWSIMEEKKHTIIQNGQLTLSESVLNNDYDAIVQAMNKLLERFSQQLTLALQTY